MIRVGAALFAPREVVPPTLRIGNRPLADLVGKDLLVEWRAEAVVIHQEA
jgi:hypothetical protein